MLFHDYDANETFPFGQANPKAPEALHDFHFMIGEFDCEDELFFNGKWNKMKGRWITNYTLNGYAIQDYYCNEVYAGTSLRIYRPDEQLWHVTFFGMPGNHTGLWKGSRDENRIVLTSEQQTPTSEPVTSRLSFSNISDDGFDWLGERVNADGEATPNWKIWARRKR